MSSQGRSATSSSAHLTAVRHSRFTRNKRGPLVVQAAKARVESNAVVGAGTQLLSLVSLEKSPPEYLPGHVLSLSVVGKDGRSARKPYTVSRVPKAGQIQLLYRVIPEGNATPLLSALQEGDFVDYEGKFHTPIIEELSDCSKVIGIATGSGIGPLLGFAERFLPKEKFFGKRPVKLFAGFRSENDICLHREMNQLRKRYPGMFEWKASLTRPPAGWSGLEGRVTSSLPKMLSQETDLRRTHFHLVGNGAMIKTMQAGLLGAGLSEKQVTTEAFFNFQSQPDTIVVARIIEELSAAVNEQI
ncbi:hypothetical protein CYMTET_11814 [Cymbomonas tetramitiformis]|uniref:FAD-binding FR-type domain-containing protein n=1 Tax=Cymbomonas tetramitiformis TaxID=36881 RepID=A0AAE0LD35_9CHLO|nr:hypothetical protein CYMTET_11814 [Cymbomonas tetramitiformis]